MKKYRIMKNIPKNYNGKHRHISVHKVIYLIPAKTTQKFISDIR